MGPQAGEKPRPSFPKVARFRVSVDGSHAELDEDTASLVALAERVLVHELDHDATAAESASLREAFFGDLVPGAALVNGACLVPPELTEAFVSEVFLGEYVSFIDEVEEVTMADSRDMAVLAVRGRQLFSMRPKWASLFGALDEASRVDAPGACVFDSVVRWSLTCERDAAPGRPWRVARLHRSGVSSRAYERLQIVNLVHAMGGLAWGADGLPLGDEGRAFLGDHAAPGYRVTVDAGAPMAEAAIDWLAEAPALEVRERGPRARHAGCPAPAPASRRQRQARGHHLRPRPPTPQKVVTDISDPALSAPPPPSLAHPSDRLAMVSVTSRLEAPYPSGPSAVRGNPGDTPIATSVELIEVHTLRKAASEDWKLARTHCTVRMS